MKDSSFGRFLDPEKILFAAGLSRGQNAVDLGAGSGFYALGAAKLVGDSGSVHVVDILDTALDHVAAEARVRGVKNIRTIKADLEKDQVDSIPAGEADMVILANIVHQIADKSNLFKLAYRVLKTGGKMVIVDWNANHSPIGPVSSSRVEEKDAKKLAVDSVFKFAGELPTDNYHYGLMFIK